MKRQELLQHLSEKIIKFENDTVTVIVQKNPTPIELKQFLDNCKGWYLRGYVGDKDIYFWSSYYYTHHQMLPKLGIEPRGLHQNYIYVHKSQYIRGAIAISYDWSDNAGIINRPPLNRYFQSGLFIPEGEVDERDKFK